MPSHYSHLQENGPLGDLTQGEGYMSHICSGVYAPMCAFVRDDGDFCHSSTDPCVWISCILFSPGNYPPSDTQQYKGRVVPHHVQPPL